ncbi:MAG: hypothetical protein CM15mP130_0800 [Verrucomicrobiota bacterium]|nr:MAG: hypothetical protein CM15mP130_0800 [Verrucomicrobiota bacterium]
MTVPSWRIRIYWSDWMPFVKLASFELDEGIRKTASLLMQNPQNSDDEWLRLPLQAMGAGNLNLLATRKVQTFCPIHHSNQLPMDCLRMDG